jgi:hypothetical protein
MRVFALAKELEWKISSCHVATVCGAIVGSE